jgi:cytochrome c oxidase subunit II
MALTQKLKTCLTVVLMSLFAGSLAASDMNMPIGVTDNSQEIYSLHMITIWVCVVIGIGVFGMMGISMWKHRKSVHPKPATFHENLLVEFIWTIVPVIILVALTIPAFKLLIKVEDTKDSEMSIQITGWQWKWQYKYMGEDIEFFSNLASPRDLNHDEIKKYEAEGGKYLLEVDNHLVIPVDTKVRFLVTARDVIHSWWVPDFAVKKDAIPGFINETWVKVNEPGTYRGQCTELCGKDHGFMPIVVDVLSKADYAVWLTKKKAEAAAAKAAAMADSGRTWAKSELMELGKTVYDTKCAACHGANGEGGVGKAITASSIATGDTNVHIDSVLNGISGSAMQAFGAQLTDAEIAAVVTYQRNALGNSVGDLVQPAEVKAKR